MRLLSLLVCLGFTSPLLSAPIPAIAYSHDGKLLAAAEGDTVHIITTENGTTIGELPGHKERITGLAFSKVGLLAVAAGAPSQSGTIALYNLNDAKALPTKPTHTFVAHKDSVLSLAFDPTGTTLATASYDRTVKLWEMPKPKAEPKLTLTDHSDSVYAVAFHPEGKLLASAGADRAVKVWDATTGQRLYTLSDATDWLYTLAWHPNGKQLAAAGVDKSIRTWDVNSEGGKLAISAFAHDAPVLKLLFNSSGNTLYTIAEDKTLKQWNAAKLTETATRPAANDVILSAALNPSDKQLSLGRFDGVLQLVDPQTWKVQAQPLPAKAQAPKAKALSSDSIIRGTSSTITFTGQHLQRVNAIQSSSSKMIVEIVTKGRSSTELQLKVKVSADAPIGSVSLIAVSPEGKSEALVLHVDRYAAMAEPKQTDSAQTASTITWPATIAGSLDRAGDTDYIRIALKPGDQLGVQAIVNDSKLFSPVLALSDSKGEVVAQSKNGLLGYAGISAGEYILSIKDAEYRGSAGHTYRLHLGTIPIVTSVFPLGVQRGHATTVHLDGVNLGVQHGLQVKVTAPNDAAIGSTIPVPMQPIAGEVPLGNPMVSISEFSSVIVSKEMPELRVPATAEGILYVPKESQILRFAAKKGERLILEVEAARRGSLLDSHIEILDTHEKPVPRAILRSVAQTTVTFRDHDSEKPSIRLENWSDLNTNDYLYGGSELLKIRALPKNPDDDCQFVQLDGKRLGMLDTTPTHHAQNSTLYKVELHPPGSTFPTNGLPLFRLNTQNDDGPPAFGADSRLVFDPPSTGIYLVRIRDAHHRGGAQFAYRLTVRPAKPDFRISIQPQQFNVWKGGAVPVTISAKRFDEYDGPIEVSFPGIDAPFQIPKTTILTGETAAVVALFADNSMSLNKSVPLKVVATATISGKKVSHEAIAGTPKIVEPGDISTTTSAIEVTLKPGAESRLLVKIVRNNGFKGRVPMDVRGLPQGVRVQNIGLNGILLQPEHSEREVVFYAEPWVKPMEIPIVVLARREGKNTEHAAKSVLLRIVK